MTLFAVLIKKVASFACKFNKFQTCSFELSMKKFHNLGARFENAISVQGVSLTLRINSSSVCGLIFQLNKEFFYNLFLVSIMITLYDNIKMYAFGQ